MYIQSTKVTLHNRTIAIKFLVLRIHKTPPNAFNPSSLYKLAKAL